MSQVRMAGEIGVGLLPDLLQLLSSNSEVTGSLEVTSAETVGRIWFQKGQMIDALWGSKSGEAAVGDMLAIRNGRFRFSEPRERRARTIYRDATCILLDSMRAIDEAGPSPVDPQQAASPPPEATAPAPSPVPPRRAPAPTPPKRVADVQSPTVQHTQRVAHKSPAPAAPAPAQPRHRRRVRTQSTPRQVQQLALAALLMAALAIGVSWSGSTELDETPTQDPVVTTVSAPDQPEYRLPSPVPVAARQPLWPRFSLSGLLASGDQDGEGAAVVNGEVVSVGERIDGMIVREIEDGGVTLEFQGNQTFQGMTDGKKRSVNRPTRIEMGLSALRDFSFVRNP
ncbi:MAG: DUF4388 domain-containing protein [Kiritimatiellae bacterium]|nr:DUF4388 domain-containing protein [Kiritimatiellia bacterium]